MQSRVFDVTLYWHEGGSIFLGTVASLSVEDAKDIALAKYIKKNKKQNREIEEGGGFELEATLLPPGEAAEWMERNT
ncbi:hypothetical protein [Delftia sp. PS-11]|uniref:hypothetical protein n=1 Tax=Delftia sp. PS-11 TaxID=2767222 RepID=UPI0024553C8B|nr:hypothetical protein [Delftia sp. PS-11]KAJ8741811.1 hypothetical protein H9T68_20835 [Delftia sp. PS-11]